ncbi:MAG: autotransporter-associated beta strand repeat-containing protein, partial [Chthoniobacterales bacterium]
SGSIAGNVTNNAALAFNRSDSVTYAGVVSGSGTLEQMGPGTLILTGDHTYTGGTTVSSGTLQLGNGGTTGSVTGNITTEGILAINHSNAVTLAGVIDGTGSVQQNGTGATTLSGNNTFTNGVTVNAGTLNIGSATAIGTGTLNIAGVSTIDNSSGSALTLANNNVQTWGANFTFAGTNDLNLGTGAVTLTGNRTVTTTANNLTVGGVIDGAFSLTKAGAGTMTLANDNTYSGGTTISAGKLQIGNGGTTGSVLGDIADNGILSFNRSDALVHNGIISGTGSVQQDGSGSTTLNGANTYSGGTTVNAGTLLAGSSTALGAVTGNLAVNGTGTFDINGNNVTVGALNGASGATITNGDSVAATLTTSSSSNGTFAGTIQDGTHSTALAKSGTGALTLTHANTYTGGTTLNAGTLNFGSATAIGTGALNIAGASTIDNISGSGLTLTSNNPQTWGANFTFTGTNDLNLGTGAVTLTGNRTITASASNLTVGGIISGAFSLNKAGAGSVTLTGANTFSGGTTLTSGQLNVNSANALGTGALTIAGGVLDNTSGVPITLATNNALNLNSNLTFTGSDSLTFGTSAVSLGSATRTITVNGNPLILDGAVGGSTTKIGLTKAGTGTLVLNGANTYAGVTTISGGTLQLGNSTLQGSLATASKITDNATLAFELPNDSTFSNVISGTGAVVQNGENELTVSGANTYKGGTTVNNGTFVLGNAKALGATTGNLTINSGTLDLNAKSVSVGTLSGSMGGAILNDGTKAATLTTTNASDTTFASAITDGVSAIAVTKKGAGALILTGTNTYSGKTTVSAGVLQFGNGGTTGSIASASLVNTGIVKVNRSNAFSYSGVISGKGSFQQNGSGTTTLTGTNTYTGGTVLNAGTLAVGNAKALGKGVVTLNDGTLATNGVQHEINVTGNLTWDSNAIIALTITEDSSSEFVNVVGQLKGLGSDPFTFDFTPVALTPGDHDFLVMSTTKGFGTLTADDFAFTSSDMGLTGTFSIVGKNLFFNDGYEPVSGGSGGMNSFADSGSVDGGLGGNISLNAGAVPEPSTWALLGLGAGFILFLRRRKMTGAAS